VAVRRGSRVETSPVLMNQKQERRHNVSVSPYLCKTYGHGVGLQYRESHLLLSKGNMELIREGMTFVVTMSVANMPLSDHKSSRNPSVAKMKHFSLLLTDTVRGGWFGRWISWLSALLRSPGFPDVVCSGERTRVHVQ